MHRLLLLGHPNLSSAPTLLLGRQPCLPQRRHHRLRRFQERAEVHREGYQGAKEWEETGFVGGGTVFEFERAKDCRPLRHISSKLPQLPRSPPQQPRLLRLPQRKTGIAGRPNRHLRPQRAVKPKNRRRAAGHGRGSRVGEVGFEKGDSGCKFIDTKLTELDQKYF